MGMIRPAAVAGAFYPGDANALAAEVASLLVDADRSSRPSIQRPPKAIIAPHAGYIYSGPIAGSAYGAVRPDTRPGWKTMWPLLSGFESSEAPRPPSARRWSPTRATRGRSRCSQCRSAL